MIERYELNQSKLPTIPAPHDAVIVKFGVDDEFLVLYFEDNISHRDSVKYNHPNANTLIMKFHLLNPELDVYQWERILKGEAYILKNSKKVIRKWNKNKGFNMSYLYHYVAYNSIIINLLKTENIYIQLEVDYIEYEWIEKRNIINFNEDEGENIPR